MSSGKRRGKPAAKPTKRERFEEAGKFPVKKVAIVAAAVVVIAVGAVVGVVLGTGTPKVGGPVVSAGGVDYADTNVGMSLLSSAQKNASATVSLSMAEVKSKKIGGFVYSRSNPMPEGFNFLQGNGLPVLAYVAPSGRLVVATSLCEPCRSYEFHIEGNQLVCNTCFTRWDLNTLTGVEGGCQSYPPKEVAVSVQGDSVQIQQSVLESWVPRI